MPTNTYTPLANITLGSSAASVTFSSISQAYRDLILVVNGQVSGLTGIQMQLNSDTGSNYSTVNMDGNGSSTSSFSATNTVFYLSGHGNNAGNRIAIVTQLMDYSATDKHKSALNRFNNAGEWIEASAHRWANTAAVTSVVIFTNASTWASGTTFSLFGVAA